MGLCFVKHFLTERLFEANKSDAADKDAKVLFWRFWARDVIAYLNGLYIIETFVNKFQLTCLKPNISCSTRKRGCISFIRGVLYR